MSLMGALIWLQETVAIKSCTTVSDQCETEENVTNIPRTAAHLHVVPHVALAAAFLADGWCVPPV